MTFISFFFICLPEFSMEIKAPNVRQLTRAYCTGLPTEWKECKVQYATRKWAQWFFKNNKATSNNVLIERYDLVDNDNKILVQNNATNVSQLCSIDNVCSIKRNIWNTFGEIRND